MNEITINNANGVLTVSSLQVAKDFSKQHKNIVQSIENLLKQTSAEFSADVKSEFFDIQNMFIENTYADSYGRFQKCYDMTRDGFSLLVMGFTGKKALEWKLRYIEAFNSMEKQLTYIHSDIEKIVSEVLDEKIETIVNKAVVEAVSETVKVLSPFLTLPKDTVKAIKKPYKYNSSKIFRLSPEVREQVDEMIVSGNYSCQKIADFITSETDMTISYMTVSRYIKKYFKF
ncbi:MAG: Rha family transcriptional regulator [Ruminococcus sp.]|nr:Rha family transcriptional regulator [Ruminococcus sp.]MDE6848722.1 Rha family transcriptional regulator [Ruminococcus sp.]